MNRRPRPLLGLILVALALFLARPQGLVGAWLSKAVKLLFGPHGLTLLVLMLGIVGLAVMFRGRWAQIGRVTFRILRLIFWGRKTAPRTVRRLHTVPADPVAEAPRAKVLTFAHLEPGIVGDVRSGLKHLGYDKAEIDCVLPQLDQRRGVSGMLRDALRLLRKAA